jgi:dipeptidyl aminopeptidase/acylaminoacyl peptidase
MFRILRIVYNPATVPIRDITLGIACPSSPARITVPVANLGAASPRYELRLWARPVVSENSAIREGVSMILNRRSLAALALPFLLFCGLARTFARAQEKTGTTQDVEKRLKGVEKPKATTGPPLDDVIRTLFTAHTFEQAALSPDGNSIAWVENVHTKTGVLSGSTVIYVKNLKNGGTPKRIKAGVADSLHAEGSVAWSPDSQRLAFLSDAAKSGQQQLYVENASGGTAKLLTSVKGFLASPTWSPDGKTIALLFTENATRASGPLVAETPETGEIKDAFFEQRLALVDVATSKFQQITPADTYVYEYAWSPDSKRFVVSSALGNGDNNWWVAELSTLDPSTGLMKSIYKPKLQIANPVWSPDGKQIAFIEGLMSDEGLTGGDIFTISSSGGNAKNLTEGMKASAAWLGWQRDGKILFSEFVGGNSAIATLDPSSGKIEQRWSAEGTFSASGIFGFILSPSDDSKTIAGIYRSYSRPPEVALITDKSSMPSPVTNRNAGLKPTWGRAKSLTWKNDGYEIQGWLLYPRDFDPNKKYPLVVDVHGGPSYIALSHWPSSHDFPSALAGMGYFVLCPNPRGSFGQGEAFTRANVQDFGYGDFKDILSGVDEALKAAPIDPNRLGITGWSYGGYMTMWVVTQTNRFKAAVAGAGIANYQSYYGENQIDQWMIPFFGKSVYDDPEVYAKSSPINFIKKAKTPTLILVGDSDGECPTPQSYEFWHALKTLGVETQFVVYEHEGHLFANPKHQRDVVERTLAWFNAHLR